jgi:ComF family protein
MQGHMTRIGAVVNRALGWGADLIWPPRSLVSDRPVSAVGAIEAEHWAQLPFITRPWCVACGLPFHTPEPDDALCPACVIEPPQFASARAALIYDGPVRKLVLDIKHAARRDGLTLYANWMAAAAAEPLGRADLVVAVPMHWSKLASRGFNQATWLAAAVARRAGLPLRHDLLVRGKRRRSQEGLSRAQRPTNAAGAYQAKSGPALAGKAVLLVDDVLTTGATANACARALKKAGAARIDVVTLARVVRPFIDIT